MRLTRHDRVWWTVTSRNRFFQFETNRTMVPVAQIRNPFAGVRSWKLRLGHLTLSWRRLHAAAAGEPLVAVEAVPAS